jgi:hypothetical protein
MIQVTCACGKELRAKAEHAGKRAKCPRCGQVLVIPQRPAAAPSAEDAAFQMFMSDTVAPEPARPPEEPLSQAAPTPAEHYRFQDEPPPAPAVSSRPKPMPPVPTPPPRTVPKPAVADRSVRHLGYWLLLLALVPLGVSLFQSESPPTNWAQATSRHCPRGGLHT